MRGATSALAVLALSLAAHAAHADCTTPLTSTCINDDNLWPHAGASHFLSIGGTETTLRDEIGVGVYTSYLSRPVVLVTNGAGAPTTNYAIDNQVNSTFMFSYGVSDRLELDAIVPITLSQTGVGASPLTGSSALTTSDVRDIRFGFAYAIVPRARVDAEAHAHDPALRRESVWALTGRMELSAPTGDTSTFGSDGYAVWSPSLSADYRRGEWFGGAEAGLRLRKTEEFQGARVGSQAFVGLGIGRDLLPHDLLSVVAEAYVLPTFAEQHSISAPPDTIGTVSAPNGQYIVPAEWMVSVRTAPLFGDLQLQAGGGGSIPFADNAPITNPRFRFSLSVRYAPLGKDSDGDGVLDKDDKCPFVHGLAGNPAGEGCPASAEHEQVDLTGDVSSPHRAEQEPLPPSPVR